MSVEKCTIVIGVMKSDIEQRYFHLIDRNTFAANTGQCTANIRWWTMDTGQ